MTMSDLRGPEGSGLRGPEGSDLRGPDREPSLEAVRRADGFINALADGRPVVPQDGADVELATLLGSWRDEVRWPPATGLISEADAVAALNAGISQRRSVANRDRWASIADTAPRRNRRGLSVVGATAAAVLCIGGFGAVVAGAGPGDALYGLRTMLFGGPKQVRDDQVALAAQTELNQVQDLIAKGDWQQAQDRLVAVSTQVESIGDQQQKQDLLEQFNDLSAKVVERDPQATAPPGVVYTVPPSAAALVPALAPPTSTPAAPALTEVTTSSTTETTSTATTSETAATSTPATESSASSAETSAGPSSTSVAPQSQQTTTPTSAAPTAEPTTTAEPTMTTVVPTTTAAPAAQDAPATTTAPATSVAPAATTTAAPPAAEAPATASERSAVEVPTTAVETVQPPAAVTTTEVIPIPIPAGG